MKKWILFAVLILIIVSGGIAFYILSQPPKEGLSDEFKEEAVTKLLGRKAQLEAENVPTGTNEYKGKYIRFSYPAKALIYTFRENSTSSKSANLEDFSFDIKSPKLIFNMKVSEIKVDIEDIPAVRLREMRSYEYAKESVKADKISGVTYYKKGKEPEKSGFFVSGGRLVSISVTGTNDEEVKRLFDDVIKTVSFL